MLNEYDELLRMAVNLARQAARVSMERFGAASAELKPDETVVTDADVAIQRFIQQAIAHQHPDHAVLAEEQIQDAPRHAPIEQARFIWVIDPIDGTRNYVAGFPCFATSIGVLEAGLPVVGVVLEHVSGSLFTAVTGQSAMLDGERIRVRKAPSDAERLVGFPSDRDERTLAVVHRWSQTPGLVLRNVGSTATHLAFVANGRLDAAFAKRCRIWDIAAGALLVTQAGGHISNPFGGRLLPFTAGDDPTREMPYLASTPELHERLLESIATA